MLKEALRPAWAEINLSNLEYNLKQVKKKVGGREIIGVVKADAYGHGAIAVSKVLLQNGVKPWPSQHHMKLLNCVKRV